MPETLAPGDSAPDFELPSTIGAVSLASALDGPTRVVLAFFHEASTPACEQQVAMLKEAHDMIVELRGRVIAISADSLEAQRAFAERLGGVPFALASDADLTVARAYGVVDAGDPRRAGRAVFVIDRDGTITHANGHFRPGNISQFEAMFAALGTE